MAFRRGPGIITALALAGFALAVGVSLTGGFSSSVFGIRLTVTQPFRAFALSTVLLAVGALRWGWPALVEAVRAMGAVFQPKQVVAALVAAVAVAGAVWTSRAAGGSDSYGYLSAADLQREGRLTIDASFAAQVPWPNGVQTFAPLGYRPAVAGSTIVPLYAQGLPMLLAAAKTVGGQCAMFLVVPCCGALLVATTFAIGRRLGSNWTGVMAAWLVATSPVFLCMLLNPMSDVPAAAFWALATLGLVSGTTPQLVLGGAAAAIAVLIRPNLAPLTLVMLVWLAITRRSTRAVWWPVMAFSAGPLAACAIVAVIDHALYGSALESGYGDLSTLFSIANIVPNLHRWFLWLTETQTPILLIGWACLYMPSRALWPTLATRQLAGLLGLVSAAVVCAYVAYLPFDSWWFLRFLLPAWPAVAIGTAALVNAAGSKLPEPVIVLGVLGVIVFGCVTTSTAADRGVFLSGQGDQRYPAVAALVQRFTDPNAVIISGQHSGSVRYYAGRLTLRYDSLDPDWLDRSVAWLADHGFRAYFLLDDDERAVFRNRFKGPSALGRLEFAPVFTYQRGPTTFFYDPARPDAQTQVFAPLDVPVPSCALPVESPRVTFSRRP